MTEIDELVRSVYVPPQRHGSWRLEHLVGHDRVRYFSYGRHALAAGLRLSGVGADDYVLIPGFICREVLSAIHSLRARVCYYEVNADLAPRDDLPPLPRPKAVLAVNYFGFPQELAPFREYCERSGCALVEDNAHGLLSRDGSGVPLGARGDIGIFSLRKTVPLVNGAALVVNASRWVGRLEPQLPPSIAGQSASAAFKRFLRKTRLFATPGPLHAATLAARTLRRLRTGNALPPSDADVETHLPGDPAPDRSLWSDIGMLDPEPEVERRRSLYAALESRITNAGGELIFPSLPPGTAPYGLPFRASPATASAVSARVSELNLDCVPWPELPRSVATNAPEHYRNAWMVSFLW